MEDSVANCRLNCIWHNILEAKKFKKCPSPMLYSPIIDFIVAIA